MVQERRVVIRVGFVFSFDDGWLGGINYFRNLLNAVYALPDRGIEAVIFTGLRTPGKHFDGFPQVKIIRSRLFDRKSIPWLIHKLWVRIFPRDLILESLLKKHDVAVLSHSGWLGKGSAIPAIGWIPDFQHVHLPGLFSSREIAARDRSFRNLCRHCQTMIVSSFDARSDLGRFEPGCAAKSKVLQFVVGESKSESTLPGRAELEKKYRFSGNYFLLPNQFWKHKNHRVVIEALGLLVAKGEKVLVLSTGNTADYRHPEYFEELMARVRQLDVADCFRPLGLVSADDLAALMLHATAIINPSLFEGWSTTVEEAKALGKRVVLSDIAVHREQDPERAGYFMPDNAAALAVILRDIWNNPDTDEREFRENASRTTDERRVEFARHYQGIVLDTLEKL